MTSFAFLALLVFFSVHPDGAEAFRDRLRQSVAPRGKKVPPSPGKAPSEYGCGKYGPAQWVNDGEAAFVTHQLSAPLALYYFSIPVFAGCRPSRATLRRSGERWRHLLFDYDLQGGGVTTCSTPDAATGKNTLLYRCRYRDVPRGRGLRLLEVRGIDSTVLLQHEISYDDFGRPSEADVTRVREATGAVFKDLPSGPESYALELYFSTLPRGTSRSRYQYRDPRLRFHPTSVRDARLNQSVAYKYKTDADGLVTERRITTGQTLTAAHRYMYDDEGRMTHDVNILSGDIEQYAYDSQSRLTTISHSGQAVFNCTYRNVGNGASNATTWTSTLATAWLGMLGNWEFS